MHGIFYMCDTNKRNSEILNKQFTELASCTHSIRVLPSTCLSKLQPPIHKQIWNNFFPENRYEMHHYIC
jgi:hypothetical protein